MFKRITMRFNYTELQEMLKHSKYMRDACAQTLIYTGIAGKPDEEGMSNWQGRIDTIEWLIGKCWRDLDEVEYITKHTP